MVSHEDNVALPYLVTSQSLFFFAVASFKNSKMNTINRTLLDLLPQTESPFFFDIETTADRRGNILSSKSGV